MQGIAKARQAKADKHLDKLISSRNYGVLKSREWIARLLADGATLEVKQWRNYHACKKLAARLDIMRRGWIPWGNPNHPETIKAQALKDAVELGYVLEQKYTISNPKEDGAYFVISKTEYTFAQSLTA
jgi:hypothetical protein